ncbi:MAG: GTP 3',8-cyclase MoaA [Chloroflexi bacterium]|nr:GTP 3',8-cyclase MoaA [Chloroflexota bacterium]
MTGLSDSFQRPITYLRVSVTDRCNLRCVYCMPEEGIPLLPMADILRYEEIATIVQAAVELGITKVRLTGGEPLARLGLADLVAMLSPIQGLDDLCLTTNGVLLGRQATELKKAGLRRVNVSLDTLKPERFRRIARRGRLEDVLEGIEAARDAGLTPMKVNTVVLRGLNDDELLDFAALTLKDEWHIRFIELMPFTDTARRDGSFISVAAMKERLESLGKLEPYDGHNDGGPARYYRYPGAPGTLGFISPVTEHFCEGCNRLRLTAQGRLRLCLLSDEEIDLRGSLRDGAGPEEIKVLMLAAVASKPRGHTLGHGPALHECSMAQIGG